MDLKICRKRVLEKGDGEREREREREILAKFCDLMKIKNILSRYKVFRRNAKLLFNFESYSS